jgi:MFS family permease
LFVPRFPIRGSLRRDLVFSTADAVAYSVMVGCGETFLPAFALALGLGPIVAGMVASVPILVGAVVQVAAPLAVARVGGNRRWVVLSTAVQGLSFLPFVVWAIEGRAQAWQLLLAASVYWSAGMAGTPAWTAWTASLVPIRIRTGYFAQRNRLGQAAVFIGFVLGGLVLQSEARRSAPLTGFAVLFAVAGIARLISTGCLAACREPARDRDRATAPATVTQRLLTAVHDMRDGPAGPLVVFLCCFAFGAQFAAPYFTPYMLDALGFSYGQYLLVFGAGFLVKALLLPAIGRFGSRLGPWRLLARASVAIVPLALLWLPSRNVGWLIVVQFMAGTCWAAYELSVALLMFEIAGDRDRGGIVTAYNLGLAVATVGGAACGGLVLRALGETPQAYAVVFTASSLLRLAALPLLHRVSPGGRP